MSGRRAKRAQFRRRAAAPAPSPSSSSATRIRASHPEDLLALVPYLLGFHPEDSVVAVMVRSGRVALTARIDLPGADHASALAQELESLANQHRASEMVVIGYGGDSARLVLDRLVAELPRVVLADALYVDGTRWFSLTCTKGCCPTEGRPYAVDAHRLAAEAVFAGMTVRGTRAELAELVVGPTAADADRLELMAAEILSGVLTLTQSQAEFWVETSVCAGVEGEALDEDDLLRLAALVKDVSLRDRAWALIGRESAAAHRQLWADVVAVTPPSLAAAPLCLLGLSAWISGDGALQNCCVERLEKLDPGYSLGILLSDISARALSPALWDQIRVELRAELGALAG
ncbi:MAG TPA: DUF4192 domain-containing protein [Propionibacteriaceae bacterium]